MAVGVLMGRQPLQGSCGGLGNIQGLGECDICGGDPSKCEEQESSSAANTENKIEQKSFYEAWCCRVPAKPIMSLVNLGPWINKKNIMN